ncbi:MAG: C4-dicarboxylate ABC transporter substrate-binding protein [Candidatus Nealsonbacteria bacterium]|nr:MAG: C4-dicarboxylate ABC transporter substrate-binding protein [Candidatus Nealsonbacteria bacterium]
MKFRKLEIILVIFALVLFFSAVTVSAADVKLTWSSISVPGDAHTEAMKVFKEEVEKLSAGHITVDLYIAGQLYTQEGELAACREGTLDMAYYGPNWLAEFVPYLSMLGAAYTFSGYNHMTKVMNGDIGKKIFDEVAEKVGVRPLAAFYLGTRELNVVEKVGPVRTPEDMKGVKLRTPASPAWIALGKALGGNPTPMSFGEVYMGLKTGAIEGQDNPLPTDKNAKFYEVTKYIILTDHVVNAVLPTINEKRWQSLSDIDKLIIRKAIEKARKFCDETNLKAESELLDFFRGQGLIIIENPDKDAFAAYAKNSYLTESKDISKDWDMTLYDEIQAMK